MLWDATIPEKVDKMWRLPNTVTNFIIKLLMTQIHQLFIEQTALIRRDKPSTSYLQCQYKRLKHYSFVLPTLCNKYEWYKSYRETVKNSKQSPGKVIVVLYWQNGTADCCTKHILRIMRSQNWENHSQQKIISNSYERLLLSTETSLCLKAGIKQDNWWLELIIFLEPYEERDWMQSWTRMCEFRAKASEFLARRRRLFVGSPHTGEVRQKTINRPYK